MLRISEQKLRLIMPLIQEKIENLRKKSVLENHERDVLEQFETMLFNFESAIEYESTKYEIIEHNKRMWASQLSAELSEDEHIVDCSRCGFPLVTDVYGSRNTIDGEFFCQVCSNNYQI